MRKQFLKNAMIIVLVTWGGFGYSQDALLKYQFVKGKTYTHEVQLANNTIQSFGGQEMKMVMDISATSEFFIEDINENFEVTAIELIKDISMHSVMMGRDTTMSFKDINEKNRVVYSKDGKQISKELIDSAAIADLAGTTNQIAKFIYLPEKAVKAGDKWQHVKTEKTEITEKNPFETIITSTEEFTFVGNETKDGQSFDKILIESNSVIEGKGSQSGMEIFMEGTGKSQGFAYFDSKASIVVYTEINTDMDMNLAIAGQENMTIPMSQSMKVITKFNEKK
ncbi:MAG: hypothetical protein AB7S50_00670 [Bacteroidales bacterium]